MTANPLSSIPPLGPTTGMTPPPQSGRFKPIDPLRVLRQYAWWLVLTLIVGVGLGVGLWAVLLKTDPQWSTHANYLVGSQASNPWAPSDNQFNGMNSDAVQRAKNSQIGLILSDGLLYNVVQQTELQNTAWYQNIVKNAGNADPLQLARKALQDGVVSANPDVQSSLFTLTVTAPNTDDARHIISAIISVYQRQLQNLANNQGSNLIAAFLRQKDQASSDVQNLKQQLSNFTTQQNIPTLQSEQSSAAINYQTLAQQQSRMQLALDQAITQHDSLAQQMQSGNLAPGPDDQAAVEAMPSIQNLESQIRQMKQQREVFLERFGENHESVRELDRRIQAAEQQKQDKIQSLLRQRRAVQLTQAAQQVEGLKQQLSMLQPKLKEASNRMADLTNQLATYHQLQTQLTQAQDNLQTANNALNAQNVSSARPDALPVRLYTPASVPVRSFPKIKLVVPATTVVVLALVVGLVFLKELLDQRVKTPADIKLIPNAELLGVVPDAAEDASAAGSIDHVVHRQPAGLLAESFRQVRAAVLSKMDRRGYKTLLVTGASPGCGSSAVAENLAASMAYNGRRVLLIDANYRQPGQHTLHGLPDSDGLVDVLRGQKSVDSVMTPIEGSGLTVMPIGDSAGGHPELFEGPRLRTVLSDLERLFDVIILDAPPALLTSESRLLAGQVDAMVLIARAQRDKRGMIERMIRQLDGQRADILGVILNGARSSAGGYFRKNYRQFYRYGNGGHRNGQTALPPSPVPAAARAEQKVRS